MLNQITKRKIDSARNILVGNVTNPISQVDQITNALIYKFMDDMDQENIRRGRISPPRLSKKSIFDYFLEFF